MAIGPLPRGSSIGASGAPRDGQGQVQLRTDTARQAELLRASRFDQLDREPIAEGIEDVGKSEQRELACRMAVLLADLLKWQFQPERRGASWETTIRTQRASIERRRRRTPSLATSLKDPDWWADAWDDALDTATR